MKPVTVTYRRPCFCCAYAKAAGSKPKLVLHDDGFHYHDIAKSYGLCRCKNRASVRSLS